MGRARPYKIVIVEDEPLLALDLHCTLEHAGYSVIGNSGSVTAAKALIERSSPDAVLLDVVMEREPNFELPDILADRSIPFMFVTVWEPNLIPLRHRRRPYLSKPCTAGQLLVALKELIASRVGAESPAISDSSKEEPAAVHAPLPSRPSRL
jgi:DNA-binding response OmpR family regulator